jgi:hypothetical protein
MQCNTMHVFLEMLRFNILKRLNLKCCLNLSGFFKEADNKYVLPMEFSHKNLSKVLWPIYTS